MSVAPIAPLFDEILDFLASTPTPEQIIAFKPSEELDMRLHDLLNRNKQDLLSAEEHAELQEFLHMNHFMNMLKIKARKKLVHL